jgi:SsrA-binding protein
MGGTKKEILKRVELRNKKASFEYHFLETYTAGIVLRGTEIKSVRMSKVNLQDAYCLLMNGELFIRNMHISEYEMGNLRNHEPKADRKLLLKKTEINRLEKKLKDQGNTIVPIKLFINDKGLAKIEIALARGKKLFDKRESIKEKDIKRSQDRGGDL